MPPRTLFQKRQGFDARTTLAAVMVAIWWVSTTVHSVESFILQEQTCSQYLSRSISKVKFSRTVRSSMPTTAEYESFAAVTDPSSVSSAWLDKGLILSSFTDGLKTNPPALDWLMNALVETLWKEEQERAEASLKESSIVSPCNGPDPVLLEQLEDTDTVVEAMQMQSSDTDWKKQLALLCRTKRRRTYDGTIGNADSAADDPIDLRVLYIPTAMYALRPGSTSKPGKQRGRNRADGKKRRDEILSLLADQLEFFLELESDDASSSSSSDEVFTVRTVTMDLDDASVKQPEEVVVGRDNGTSTNDAKFPESGKEAIRDWKPHLVYVQGGNTFWLHHCMEKGDWTEDLTNACCFDSSSSNNNDGSSFSAVYCGVSAGAILAGQSMQTACWKEWDDPSVVPGKETYGDWTDIKGLDASGQTSWFPHLTEEWKDLAERKTRELLESTASTSETTNTTTTTPSDVRCIRDDQAYAVDGRTQIIKEL